jgi:hypothetical protein
MIRDHKYLIALAAVVGVVTPLGAATALADDGSSPPIPSTQSPKAQEPVEAGTDHDNIQSGDQSGDQSGPDTPDGAAEAASPDTDNVQSGDQSGADTPDSAVPPTAPTAPTAPTGQ